jgi:gamma-D-glutamyl-L-lysine dipeptidyl-peptidase
MIPSLTAPGRALVRAPVAPMYAEPDVASAQLSQRVAGHELELLEARDDWFLARGTDEYEGWMHRGFLAAAPPVTARGSAHMPRISLGCVTRTPAGDRRALPLGAMLSPDEVVKSGDVINLTDLGERFPATADAITRSAKELFEGASYLWGGITPWGADCSGFVQTIYGLHGVALPRDAWQQSETGTDAGKLDELRPADLAFFTDRTDRRASHVAISLGENRIVHLALGRGGYATERLGDPRDPYVAVLRSRFLRARRVL